MTSDFPVAYTLTPSANPGVPTLALLHGFTGSAAGWVKHAEIWAKTCQILAVDALGHGKSPAPADPSRYTMAWLERDFVAVLDSLQLERVILLGYSMGGRMALHLAVNLPERISALILESASPGLVNPAERAARVTSDTHLAERLELEGIMAFVAYWENIPLFASQHHLPPEILATQREQRLNNNPQGLANSLRGAGTGAQKPLQARLNELKIPVLLIAGELDTKFCGIAKEMHGQIPDSRLEIIGGAGHTVHLEKPEIFDKIVLDFIQSLFKGVQGNAPPGS